MSQKAEQTKALEQTAVNSLERKQATANPAKHDMDDTLHDISQTIDRGLELGIDYEQSRLESEAATPEQHFPVWKHGGKYHSHPLMEIMQNSNGRPGFA